MAFVRVTFDVQCLNPEINPRYRLWLEDELFTDRMWIWDERTCIRENLQIEAPPGTYTFQIESLSGGKFTITDPKVIIGSGEILSNMRIKING